MNVDPEIVALFRAEVAAQLDDLSELLGKEPGALDVAAACRIAHNIKGVSRMLDVVPVRDVAHQLEDLLVELREGRLEGARVVGVAREGGRALRAAFEAAIAGRPAPSSAQFSDHVKAMLGALAPVTEPRPEAEVAVPAVAPISAPAPVPAPAPGLAAAPEPGAVADTLRIGIGRVEKLMEVASELLTSSNEDQVRISEARRLLTLVAEQRRQHSDTEHAGHLSEIESSARSLLRLLSRDAVRTEQVAGQVQDGVRALRMVPLDGLRPLLERVVREACDVTHRQAALSMEVSGVELDRAMLDVLRDPLVHVLRNAVAHGIESPQERTASGKPARGTIRLQARSAGSFVEILVSDDGRGISPEGVRRVALSRRLATEQELASVGPKELLEFVFQPGFSTAPMADEISGRGVGLDVVRRNLGGVGGQVSVETMVGRGSTFSMRVPLTRLVTRMVVARLGRRYFAVPAVSIERSLFIDMASLRPVDGALVVVVRGQPIPTTRLEQVLGVESDGATRRPAMIVIEGDRRSLVLVDEVLGERELVAQPLPWNIKRAPGLAGAAVLNSGTVVMILHGADLVAGAARATTFTAAGASKRVARRVLVVDDSVTSRTLERNILTSAGYQVDVAEDGQAGWEALQNGAPDLVISDVEMPRLDGFELTARIRSSEKYRAIPVILVTSLGKEEHRLRGAEAGANAYVVKGAFDQDELLKHVARLL